MKLLKKIKKFLHNKSHSKENFKTDKPNVGLFRNDDFRGFVIASDNKNHFVIDYDKLFSIYNKVIKDQIPILDLNEAQGQYTKINNNIRENLRKVILEIEKNNTNYNYKQLLTKSEITPTNSIASDGEILKFIKQINNRNKSSLLRCGLPSNHGIVKIDDYNNFNVSVDEYKKYSYEEIMSINENKNHNIKDIK